VLRGEERGSGEDEATHRGEGAAERHEDALEAGEHAFAAGAVFADDDGGGFAEPEGGALVGRGVFEECLEDAAPRIPMRAGAEEKAVRSREGGEELRVESGGWRVGSRSSHGERCEGETFDGGAAGEEAVGAGEEDGGVARVAGEGGVEKEHVGAAGGHGGTRRGADHDTGVGGAGGRNARARV
jgi:hypothetical protein